MNNKPLTEKEFEIINIIADGFRSSQRELSSHVGLSLGMTNLLLRRLVTKGYLRIKQLNRKKIEYLLTARGFSEKAQKTYHYTLKTIESFSLIKEKIIEVLNKSITPQTRHIHIIGEGPVADFALLSLQEYSQGRYRLTSGKVPNLVQTEMLLVNAASVPGDVALSPSVIDLHQILAMPLQQRKYRRSKNPSSLDDQTKRGLLV